MLKKILTFYAIITLSLTVCFVSNSFSQEVVNIVHRHFSKTLTYYDMALIASPRITNKPSDFSRKYFASLLASKINLPRFYWESLPEVVISKFSEVTKTKRYQSVEEISRDVQMYLSPEVVKILDIEKEIKALQLLSEEDRNKFISTKAKTLGIDAEKLERVMNSGYIVIPFIDGFTVKKDTIKVLKDKKELRIPRIKVELGGGLAFFRVNFVNNEYSIKLEYEVRDNGDGFVEEGVKSILSPIDSAFIIASKEIAVSFGIAVREIFKLSSPIISAGFNSVWFNLGKKEGIYIDDGFDVFELVEKSNGQLEERNVGFVRVTKVTDNINGKDASKAQIIIGSLFGSDRLASGMFIKERPRFPFDFTLGFSTYPVTISTGNWKLSNLGVPKTYLLNNDTLEIKKEKLLAYTGRITLNINLGRYFAIPQFWFTLDANIGTLPINVKFFGNDVKSAIFGSFNFGLMRKFYFRRLSLTLELKSGFSNFNFNTEVNVGSDSVEYALSLRDWIFGLGPGVGFELVINPDINIGGKILYWYTGTTSEWSFLRKVGDNEKRWKLNFTPKFTHLRGFSYQLYLNMSIKNFAKVRKL